METIFYFILAVLTVLNAVLAYTLHTKISALEEIISDLASEETTKEDEGFDPLADWDITINDGLEDEDFSDWEVEETSWEDNIEDRLADMEHSLNYHVNDVNEIKNQINQVASFADQLSGRIDGIIQAISHDKPGL